MRYNRLVIELSANLRAGLAAAAEDADRYHHNLCELFDFGYDEDGAPTENVCTCAGPGLLRALASEFDVGYIGVEALRR